MNFTTLNLKVLIGVVVGFIIYTAVIFFFYGRSVGVDHGYEQAADEIAAVQKKYEALLKAKTETTVSTSTTPSGYYLPKEFSGEEYCFKTTKSKN
jgi:hypothetical protein